MRSLAACFLASCFFLALVASAELSSPTVSVANQSEADWTWPSENFRSVLDHTFALEKGDTVLVSYRSYESLQVGDSEYFSSISERPGKSNANLTAHVRIPEGKPIGGQLLAFHHDSPEGSATEAEKYLKFKDWELSEEQCPVLRTVVQKLAKVRFEFTWPDKIFVDPTVHEFHFASYSTSADFSIVDSEHPLVQWALDTRQAIQACGAANHPSNKPVGSSKK
jgi:hypothetical protein